MKFEPIPKKCRQTNPQYNPKKQRKQLSSVVNLCVLFNIDIMP